MTIYIHIVSYFILLQSYFNFSNGVSNEELHRTIFRSNSKYYFNRLIDFDASDTLLSKLSYLKTPLNILYCGFSCAEGSRRGFLYGETRKYSLNGIGKNSICFGGFRKKGTLSHMEIFNFGGRIRQNFKSYWHWYCLNGSITLFQGLNDVWVPKSDQ